MFDGIEEDYLYINSDHLFYSNYKKFYDVYEKFLSDICLKYIDKCNTYFDIDYQNLYHSYLRRKQKNEYEKLSFFALHSIVRIGINFPILLLQFPLEIYDKNLTLIMNNVKRFNENKIKFINKSKSKQYLPSGTPEFGSEKYHFLNAINKSKVLSSRLPSIGLMKRKVNFLYKKLVFPLLRYLYKIEV